MAEYPRGVQNHTSSVMPLAGPRKVVLKVFPPSDVASREATSAGSGAGGVSSSSASSPVSSAGSGVATGASSVGPMTRPEPDASSTT